MTKEDIPICFLFLFLVIVCLILTASIYYLNEQRANIAKQIFLQSRIESKIQPTIPPARKKEVELAKVMACESGGDPNAQNPHSTASGTYQFLDSTAKWVYREIHGQELDMKDKNNPAIQREMAEWLYDRYGLSHWEYPCGTLKT